MPDAYNPWGAPVFPTAADNAMQPETFVPQGVRDWTQQAAPKDYNILSQIAGSLGKALMYPGQVAQSQTPISTEDMIAPAFNLASMLTLGAGAAPQEANALNMGIKAYHGSPHDFDKFDLSKIGTGEGAQAYGHGLYFADNEGVAKSYRDQLKSQAFNFDGKTMPRDQAVDALAERVRQAMPEAQQPSNAAQMVADWTQNGLTPPQIESRINAGAWPESLKGEIRAAAQVVQDSIKPNPGHMYEVNINADPSHFLDWDKPLSQQPQALEAMHKAGFGVPKTTDLSFLEKRAAEDGPDSWYAMQLNGLKSALQKMPSELGLQDPKNAQALREAGIPGIKYLDQGSRNITSQLKAHEDNLALAKSPEVKAIIQKNIDELKTQGSSNYVVFNHDLIDIMRKYAVPGMLGAPILANALSEQKT